MLHHVPALGALGALGSLGILSSAWARSCVGPQTMETLRGIHQWGNTVMQRPPEGSLGTPQVPCVWCPFNESPLKVPLADAQ